MFCLLTIVSDKFAPIRRDILSHRQRICDECNMRCITWDREATRPVSWMKIQAVLDSMHRCDRILWLDGDATPRHAFKFPVANPPADLVAVLDDNGLNAGILLMNSTQWLNETMRIVWDRTEFLNHPWWEQEALRRSIYEHRVDTASIRLTSDTPKHFRHIAGCFSTTPAHVCRRKVLDDIAAFRGGCRKMVLSTVPVTLATVWPHPGRL